LGTSANAITRPPFSDANFSAAPLSENGTASSAPMPPFLRLPITKNALRASTQFVVPGLSQSGALAMSDT
jgi:hypothetical protein